jgi:hypothetical protein
MIVGSMMMGMIGKMRDDSFLFLVFSGGVLGRKGGMTKMIPWDSAFLVFFFGMAGTVFTLCFLDGSCLDF